MLLQASPGGWARLATTPRDVDVAVDEARRDDTAAALLQLQAFYHELQRLSCIVIQQPNDLAACNQHIALLQQLRRIDGLCPHQQRHVYSTLGHTPRRQGT